jgi:hypothetical protein
MTSINEITRSLGRWLAEHNIEADGFTLILNFDAGRPAAQFDLALRYELRETAFVDARNHLFELNLHAFKMNGIQVRIESPVHQVDHA